MDQDVIADARDERTEEIWGSRWPGRTWASSALERPAAEDIWGPAPEVSIEEPLQLASLWEVSAGTPETPDPSPPPAIFRQSFVLPNAWVGLPRRARWRRRRRADGRLSRRTG
jgi:hypothetical protein